MAGTRSTAASKMLDFQPDDEEAADDGDLDAEAEEANSQHIDFGDKDAQGMKNIYQRGKAGYQAATAKKALPTE